MSKTNYTEKERNDFYLKFRAEMREWVNSKSGKENKYVDYLMVAPDLFHLLCKLTLEKDVPVKHKAKLVGVIAYFISPLDAVPEAFVGPAGYVDDIALACYALNSMLNEVDSEIVIRNWAGDEDLLNYIQTILGIADNMLGSGMLNKIINSISSNKDK